MLLPLRSTRAGGASAAGHVNVTGQPCEHEPPRAEVLAPVNRKHEETAHTARLCNRARPLEHARNARSSAGFNIRSVIDAQLRSLEATSLSSHVHTTHSHMFPKEVLVFSKHSRRGRSPCAGRQCTPSVVSTNEISRNIQYGGVDTANAPQKKASATPKKRERERSEGLVNLVLAFVAHRLPARPGEFGGPCGLQRRSNNAQRSSAPSCRRHQQQPRRAPLIQKCLGRREDHSVSCMRHTHTPRASRTLWHV